MYSINYWKILGNAGATFCTSLLALMTAGVMQNHQIEVAVLTAILNGGLAAFVEIQKESNSGDAMLPPAAKSVLGFMTI